MKGENDMMLMMFLLGVLAGVVLIFSIGIIAAVKDESNKRKEKKDIQAKTASVESVLYKASWSLGYICGKHDAKAGIDEIPAVAYKRFSEQNEEEA